MPILRAISGPHSGEVFVLSAGSTQIGRTPESPICLSRDAGISRQHARIDLKTNTVSVHDLGSRNGVFVNKERTFGTLLQVGDMVQLGNTVLQLEIPEQVSAPASSLQQGSPVPPAPSSAPNTAHAPVLNSLLSPQPHTPAVMPGLPGVAFSIGNAHGSMAERVPYANWYYFLAFSLPPIGLVLSVMFLLRDTPSERKTGWWLLIWSAIGTWVLWISWVELMKFLPLLRAVNSVKGLGSMGNMLGGGG